MSDSMVTLVNKLSDTVTKANKEESKDSSSSSSDDDAFISKDTVVQEMSPVEQKDTKGNTNKYGGYLTVGAEEGWRFTVTYKSTSTNLELYRYDSKNLDDTAKDIINSVKSDGKFKLNDTNEDIEAYLSADENFLMIYQDSTNNKKIKKSAVEFFESYEAK
jgi:hypothetical protein